MIELSLLIITLIFLTFSSGYFSGSETALFSLSPMVSRAYRTDPNPTKRLIAHLLLQPRDLLVTVFMLNTFVNILLQNVSSHMFGAAAGWGLKVGVPLVITLVFGEIIPKNIGMQHNEFFSYLVAPSINWMHHMLVSVRKLTITVTGPISRFMFFFLKKEESISKDELSHVLKTSEEYGVLHPDEAELVSGYLELQDVTVKELMRPREDILFYEIHEPLSKLIHLFVDQECTRIPVCEKNIDKVLGIVSAKQFFLHRHELKSPDDVQKIMVKPFYIPETTPARVLLRRFDEAGRVIAIVVDEYGAISGLITREDLVEVVVGEIEDRRDQELMYTKAGRNEIIASGKLELSDFNDIFSAELDSPISMVTIGGWLTEQLGEIPKSGTKYQTEDFFFHVLASDPNRIRRLYIRKIGIKRNR